MENEKKEFNEWNFVVKVLKDIEEQGSSEFDISKESTNMFTDLVLIDDDGNSYSIEGTEAQSAFKEVLTTHNLEYDIIPDAFKALIKPKKD